MNSYDTMRQDIKAQAPGLTSAWTDSANISSRLYVSCCCAVDFRIPVDARSEIHDALCRSFWLLDNACGLYIRASKHSTSYSNRPLNGSKGKELISLQVSLLEIKSYTKEQYDASRH